VVNIDRTVYPLPVTDADTLLVNQGLVPVMIGTMRDNLGALGMSLQPLASLIVGSGKQYFAVAPTAPSGGVELDMIEGGAAFSPSPQQVVSILNSQTLANQIGAAVPVPPSAAAIGAAVPVPPTAGAIGTATNNAGSRLVNTLTANTLHNFSGVGDSFIVDCTSAVSFALFLDNWITSGSAGVCTAEFMLEWLDATQTYIVDRTNYEVNSLSSGAHSPSVINDQCLAPFCRVTWTAFTNIGGASVPAASAVFVPQSIPTGRLRMTDLAALGAYTGQGDGAGYLSRSGAQALAAGAGTNTFQCTPTSGGLLIMLSGVSSPSNAQFRLRGGFGHVAFSAGDINLLTPAALAASNTSPVQLVIPASPSRPFMYSITNIGTGAGTAHAEIMSTPD
jgi:hypothetical protein